MADWEAELNQRDMIIGACAGAIAVAITNIVFRNIFSISEVTRNVSFIGAAIIGIIIMRIIQGKKWRTSEKTANGK